MALHPGFIAGRFQPRTEKLTAQHERLVFLEADLCFYFPQAEFMIFDNQYRNVRGLRKNKLGN